MQNSKAIASVHSALFPSHGVTELVKLPSINGASIYVKDESRRFGLPAFKVLGASWALCSALSKLWGVDPDDVTSLRRRAVEDPLLVVAATDGNHGRALAHVSRLLHLPARILVPSTVEQWSIDAIASEGATVQVVNADYDTAVQQAAVLAEAEHGLLIQDTAWKGYEDVPLDIVHGYTRLFAEVDEQLGKNQATHVIVPVGVGSLAHAAVLWYHPADGKQTSNPKIITVEPTTAACLQTSLHHGQSISITTGETIMPGLNCGTVSSLAWPDLLRAIEPSNAVTVTDDEASNAMRRLEDLGLPSGPCGAAALAALSHISITAGDVIVLICTEGPQQR